jgi:hypothetical protein
MNLTGLRVIMGDFPTDPVEYVFLTSGLWMRVSLDDWQQLTQAERKALAGCHAPEIKEDSEVRSGDETNVLVGLPGQRPLLPYTFTADELLAFEESSGGAIAECLPMDHDDEMKCLEEWEQARGPGCDAMHAAAVITRTLLGLTERDSPVPQPLTDTNTASKGQKLWKMQAQAIAAELWTTLRKSGANPTVAGIVDRVAQLCAEKGVLTDIGIDPSPGYLRQHVLRARHWTPPDI